MTVYRRFVVLSCFTFATLWGQSPTITPRQNDYFRYLLDTLGNPAYDQQVVKSAEEGFIVMFGLNEQETATLRAATSDYRAAFTDFSAKARAITSSKTGALSSSDRASLQALGDAMDRRIALLATNVLMSVRPETAAVLRATADSVGKRKHQLDNGGSHK